METKRLVHRYVVSPKHFCRIVFISLAACCVTAAVLAQPPIDVPNGNFENWTAIGDGGVTATGWQSVPAGFTPQTNVGRNDEMWSNPGSFGSGWQENLKLRTDGKYGLAQPSNGQHTKANTSEPYELAVPANGKFIGFANLVETDGAGESISQVQSGVVGTVQQGTYQLNVAVGARLGAAWEPIEYTISLVSGDLVAGDPAMRKFGTSGGTMLGSATATLDPPGVANTSEWQDLQLLVTVGAGHANLGQSLAIRIDTRNVGNNQLFTQANFDNVRLTGPVGLIPGDTNGNGVVDLDDFEPIRANFRKNVTLRGQGDLVPNNMVDFDDFHQWKTAFLGAGGSLAGVDLSFIGNVPEPTTAVVLLVSIGMLTCARRRM